MPHTKTGEEIKVGDRVIVEFKVKSLTLDENYCNVTLETVEPMFPGEYNIGLTLNAKQIAGVVKFHEI